MKRQDWESEADHWIAWARTPEHDSFHDFGPSFFVDIVPPPGRRTLDLGCGEGRVTRALDERGHDVVGIEASPTLVQAANSWGGGRFAMADAAHLPFPNASFDLVVAYNVLMDMDDLRAAVHEVARVLEPGGHVAACILHPFFETGRFASHDVDAPFVVERSYFDRGHYRETFTRAGLTMTFSSSRLPLEDYARAFEAAGLVIERVREPIPPPTAIEKDPREERWLRMPLFLFLRLRKLHQLV